MENFYLGEKGFIHLVITVHARETCAACKIQYLPVTKMFAYGEVLPILGALLVQDSVSITEIEMVSTKK